MSNRGGEGTTAAAERNREESETQTAPTGWEVRVLKYLLFVYILLALIIAGLNYGWAPQAPEKTRAAILAVWQFYENQFKTLLIIVCSILTLRVVNKKETPGMRRYNLIGLISAALVVHVALPLVGRRRKLGRVLLGFFAVMRWMMLGISLMLTVVWLVILIFDLPATVMPHLETFETYKYLVVELLLAMFFWTVLIGRGYCYYCPLGTVLGWVGRAVGQKIVTTKSKCIGCGKCDDTCPLSIRIKDKAEKGEAVVDPRCVGCGHCIDACPVHTLAYSTSFLKRIGRV
jgi:ferredoxin